MSSVGHLCVGFKLPEFGGLSPTCLFLWTSCVSKDLVRRESGKQGDEGGLRNSAGGGYSNTLWIHRGVSRLGLGAMMGGMLLRVRETSQGGRRAGDRGSDCST